MRNITISDGRDTVRLLADAEFTWTPALVARRAVMASGLIVMDVTGVKNRLEIPTGWLSPEDLALLKRMIASNASLTVSYPTPEGDRRDECCVEMPVFRAFRYDNNGVSQWYGVTLTAEQVGVDPFPG